MIRKGFVPRLNPEIEVTLEDDWQVFVDIVDEHDLATSVAVTGFSCFIGDYNRVYLTYRGGVQFLPLMMEDDFLSYTEHAGERVFRQLSISSSKEYLELLTKPKEYLLEPVLVLDWSKDHGTVPFWPFVYALDFIFLLEERLADARKVFD